MSIAAYLLLSLCVFFAHAAPCPPGLYNVTNLLSDSPSIRAANHDANFINAWGIAAGPTSPIWINAAGTSLSYIVNGQGAVSFTVVVPGSEPTGLAFNPTNGFPVTPGGPPANFIFVSISGEISAWAGAANRTHALVTVDNSASGAAYTGVALASRGNQTFLFAANFGQRRVDVYDANWNLVTPLFAAALNDSELRAGGFAPFNVMGRGGRLFVAYALVDPETGEDLPGVGNGFIGVIDLNEAGTPGQLTRLTSGGSLNSPWGMELAPSNFGSFSDALLVGNFGDGLINAYNPTTGAFLGMLHRAEFGPNDTIVDAGPIMIDGLWGLLHGNGAAGTSTSSIYFAAGPGHETHGLFGSLSPVTSC